MPQVNVKDNDGTAIYSYNATSKTLVLSSKATDTYKVAVPTVVYSFKKTPSKTATFATVFPISITRFTE